MSDLTIVVPVYKPLFQWELHFTEIYEEICRRLDGVPEVIMVFDGDYSIEAQKVRAALEKFPLVQLAGYEENKGKGYALRYGVNKASGTLVIYTDNDFPYTVDSFMKIYDCLEQGADVAIGVKDAAYYDNIPAQRKWISLVLRRLIRAFFNLQITDTQCGLKGFNANGRKIFLRTIIDRYLCDLEFVYDLFHQKSRSLVVTPIEITLREDIAFSKMSPKLLIKQCWDFARILFKKS